MPLISTEGAASAQGFGFLKNSNVATYIEDVFSTYIYTGNGATQTINNGIPIGDSNVFNNESTTNLPNGTNRSWLGLGYGNGQFLTTTYVNVSPFASNVIQSSSNGVTWTNNTTSLTRAWFGVAYGNSKWVITSQYIDATYVATAMYSSTANGTFSQGSGFPSTIVANKTRWVNNRFITTAQSGTTMAYSLDGINWSSMTVPLGDWYDVTYGAGTYVCVQQTSGSCMTSTDGTTWTQSGSSIQAYGVAFGNGVFVAVGGSGFYVSSNGVTWTSYSTYTNIVDIVFDGVNFVMPCLSGASRGIAYSTNGTTWVFRSTSDGTFLGATNCFIAAGSSMYVLVGRTTSPYSAVITSLVPSVIGKGGLVWTKLRNSTVRHVFIDSARGNFELSSDSTGVQAANSDISFNSTGYRLANNTGGVNNNTNTFVSWTFRKQPKFFDVVTWTGDGATTRNINHSLTVQPAAFIVKATSTTGDWHVVFSYNNGSNYFMGDSANGVFALNSTNIAGSGRTAAQINISSTTIDVAKIKYNPTSANYDVNAGNQNGVTYVAYVFASNAGGFGLTGTDNVISCGSYTGSNGVGQSINVGFEPQWLLVKNTSRAGQHWVLMDNMRQFDYSGFGWLIPNLTSSESAASGTVYCSPTATGFKTVTTNAAVDYLTDSYIYIAIRRGPMKVPTSGASVFNAITRTGTSADATVTGVGFAPDVVISKDRDRINGNGFTPVFDKLRGIYNVLYTAFANAEVSANSTLTGFLMDGISVGGDANAVINNLNSTYINWFFKRSPGFMDVVCYTGTNNVQNVTHNLGVVPELMIVKSRSLVQLWPVYASSVGNTQFLRLNGTNIPATDSTVWNNTTPTSSVFTVGASTYSGGSSTYVAYLFATCAGVSKVGSYTGNGSSQTINCGFTGGARFILIKRTDSTGDWYVWDSARGIVAANDPHLSLNTTVAEVTTDDSIDPDSTGFIVNQVTGIDINVTSATYIFLAVA